MGGLLAGIGKVAMGGLKAFAGAAGGGGGGGGEGGAEGAEGGGGGGADIGGIVKGVGELVTGIIGATKGGGEAKAAEGEGGEAKAAPKDPIAQLKAMLDKAKSPEEVDALVAKVADKLGKADPKVMQAVQGLAQEKRLDLIAEGI